MRDTKTTYHTYHKHQKATQIHVPQWEHKGSLGGRVEVEGGGGEIQNPSQAMKERMIALVPIARDEDEDEVDSGAGKFDYGQWGNCSDCCHYVVVCMSLKKTALLLTVFSSASVLHSYWLSSFFPSTPPLWVRKRKQWVITKQCFFFLFSSFWGHLLWILLVIFPITTYNPHNTDK